jgi:hypothetical protein
VISLIENQKKTAIQFGLAENSQNVAAVANVKLPAHYCMRIKLGLKQLEFECLCLCQAQSFHIYVLNARIILVLELAHLKLLQ